MPRGGPAPRVDAAFRTTATDFVVEEVAAYEPSGDGTHTWLWIQKQDISTLDALFTPLEGSVQLLNAIQQDFEVYDSISLTFSIDRILIAQHDYAIHLHWEGVWYTAGQDLPLRERGLSVFKFTGNQQITLHTIDGDNPFGMDRRNIPGNAT